MCSTLENCRDAQVLRALDVLLKSECLALLGDTSL